MDDARTITIDAGRVAAEIAPEAGGRLAQLRFGEVELLVGRAPGVEATGWGSYPMVPWAGRIRHGRFVFDGAEYRLPRNFGDHSIHGVGFELAWTVTGRSDDRATLELALPEDRTWPFGGVASQQIAVDPGGITMSLTVTADHRPMPVSFGWHPWFVKPDRIDFRPTAMYRRDADHIAVDELVDPSSPSPGERDDCYLNTDPITVDIGGVCLELTSSCDRWVLYDQPAHATCIEPQTAPPDAFNIAVHRLEPGAAASAWYRIAGVPPTR